MSDLPLFTFVPAAGVPVIGPLSADGVADQDTVWDTSAAYDQREAAMLRLATQYLSISYSHIRIHQAEAMLELAVTAATRHARDMDVIGPLMHIAYSASSRVSPTYQNQEVCDALLRFAAARPLPRVARRRMYLKRRNALEWSSKQASDALGALMHRTDAVPAGGVEMIASALDLMKKKGVPLTTRHNLSRYVVGNFLNRHGLAGNNREMRQTPPAVRLVPAAGGVYTIGPDAVCLPGALSDYYYHVIAFMDENKDVVCNSGCQFGKPTDIIKFWWLGGVTQDRCDKGVPAMLKTLGALRGQQPVATRGRYKADRALIDAAILLRSKSGHLYRKNRKLIPVELRPYIERKGRHHRLRMRRRMKLSYTPGGY